MLILLRNITDSLATLDASLLAQEKIGSDADFHRARRAAHEPLPQGHQHGHRERPPPRRPGGARRGAVAAVDPITT